jgi:hypothetical protein
MPLDQELATPAGRMAVVAARLVSRMSNAPGAWDFLEEFRPMQALFDLESKAAENKLAQTAAAAEEGKRLYLYNRGLELANAIQAAKNTIFERERDRVK